MRKQRERWWTEEGMVRDLGKLPRGRWGLKLTDPQGKPLHGGVLRVGKVVKRKKGGDVDPCGPQAVHTYSCWRQMVTYDAMHCGHGERGVVWLVVLAGGCRSKDPHDKCLGKSYKVIKRVGRRGEV